MENSYSCKVCGFVYKAEEEVPCPECTRRYQDESTQIESAFFEDDVKIKLRDGKVYSVPPCSLKNARRLMQLLKTINIDMIMLNFIPTGDFEQDEKRIDELYEALSIAFVNYPEIDREFMEDNIDVKIAESIIQVLIGLNGLKK